MSHTAMAMAGPRELPQPDERALPEPGRGKAVVRLRVSSMNYHDYVNLLGFINGPWPRVPMTAIGASLGADHLNNYRNVPDWHTKLREITIP